MLGQEHLQQQMKQNKHSFIIIQGNRGSGKKEITKWWSNHINAQIYIPEDLKVDSVRTVVEESQTLGQARLFLFADCDGMTIQAQNALLKLVEEPPINSFIVMTVVQFETILPTILSRAKIMRMSHYPREVLSNFTQHVELLDIFNTPGDLIRVQQLNWQEMINLANRILNSIGSISLVNSFNILHHVKQTFGEDNYDLFLEVIYSLLGRKLRGNSNSDGTVQAINTVTKYKRLLPNRSLNKDNLLEMMFIELREDLLCHS